MLAPLQILDPDGAMALEQDLCRQRICLDLEIWPGPRRFQISDRRAAAAAIADRLLRAAEPLLLRAIVILGHRVAGTPAGRQIGLDERVLVACSARRQRPVAAAIGARSTLPRFLAAEIGQHI